MDKKVTLQPYEYHSLIWKILRKLSDEELLKLWADDSVENRVDEQIHLFLQDIVKERNLADPKPPKEAN